MNISVNCPSYKRPKVDTLKYLPFCRVWVDPAEADAYRKANPGAEIIECAEGVQGNVSRVRNHILDREFERGMDAVLIIDDDMSGVYVWDGPKEMPYVSRRIEADEFMPWVEKYTQLCNDLGFKLWGCNCNRDQRSYMQTQPFSFSSFIGGPFGCFLSNPLRYDERLPLKEDYDMTIQQCNKHRGVLRVNYAFYDCKQSKQIGGCATYRNIERERQQFELLQKKWGSEIVRRDNGKSRNQRTTKIRKFEDYNPIIKIPIRGV